MPLNKSTSNQLKFSDKKVETKRTELQKITTQTNFTILILKGMAAQIYIVRRTFATLRKILYPTSSLEIGGKVAAHLYQLDLAISELLICLRDDTDNAKTKLKLTSKSPLDKAEADIVN